MVSTGRGGKGSWNTHCGDKVSSGKGSSSEAVGQKAFACFNCFQTGHISRDCPASCRVCGGFACSSASHFAEGGAPIDEMGAGETDHRVPTCYIHQISHNIDFC